MKIEVDYPGTGGFLHSDERGELRRVGAVRSSKSGFTLFELIVTIAVSSILVGIAVPSYRNLIVSNRLTTVTNDFIANANLAKLESVRRNTAIQVCAAGSGNNGSDGLGTACTGAVCGNGTSATAGTICTLNSDGSAAKLYGAPKIPTAIILNAPAALRYGGQGLARRVVGDTAPTYTGLLIDVSTVQLTTNNHRCVYVTTGSTISSCSFTSSTDGCPASEPTNCR